MWRLYRNLGNPDAEAPLPFVLYSQYSKLSWWKLKIFSWNTYHASTSFDQNMHSLLVLQKIVAPAGGCCREIQNAQIWLVEPVIVQNPLAGPMKGHSPRELLSIWFGGGPSNKCTRLALGSVDGGVGNEGLFCKRFPRPCRESAAVSCRIFWLPHAIRVCWALNCIFRTEGRSHVCSGNQMSFSTTENLRNQP